MWAGLTPDSKGDPTGDTGEPDRRYEHQIDETLRVASVRLGPESCLVEAVTAEFGLVCGQVLHVYYWD